MITLDLVSAYPYQLSNSGISGMLNQYPCHAEDANNNRCNKSSVYYACDNKGKHGHICEEHWLKLDKVEQEYYKKLKVSEQL